MPMKYYDSVRNTLEMCMRAAVVGVQLRSLSRIGVYVPVHCNCFVDLDAPLYKRDKIHNFTAKFVVCGSCWQQFEKSRVPSELLHTPIPGSAIYLGP